MYRSVHRRLALLFAGISSLILIIMSVCYLYSSEHDMAQNNFLSFSGEMNTLIANLESQSTITNDWLSKVSADGKYLIAIYDNDTPLSYTSRTLSESELQTAQSAFSYYKVHNATDSASEYVTPHQEFAFASAEGDAYYVSVALMRRGSGTVRAIILYSIDNLTSQLLHQRYRILLLDLIGVLALFLFSWYYTKKLLAPIQVAQQNQNAFIAAASHELRTPLAVILSSVSALNTVANAKSEGSISRNTTSSDTAVEQQFLATITSESKRMSTLVDDLLTLARADNHSWSFQMEDVELDTLLLDCYESFEPLVREKGLLFEIELPDIALPTCRCDRERISQVLGVLISNAISYSPMGTAIHLALNFHNSTFSLTVADHGPGIPDKEKPHIFERFYRADDSRSKKEHFGLGLCIAKEIVDAHHGTLRVSDTVGGGATFTVLIRQSSSDTRPPVL